MFKLTSSSCGEYAHNPDEEEYNFFIWRKIWAHTFMRDFIFLVTVSTSPWKPQHPSTMWSDLARGGRGDQVC